jgi:radical SAM superfamily enzyme YgiQ (UPF0313 family)
MKLLFIYINPTGRTAIPPNISQLIGHVKSKRPYEIELFDTSFYRFDLGASTINEAWTVGYFLPVKNNITMPEPKDNLANDLSMKVSEFKPDLIALSAYSNQYYFVKRILTLLKEKFPDVPNVLGGCHASFCPDEVISDSFVDMICVGEGEEALVDLCDRIENMGDITTVNNIWSKKGGRVIRNPVRAPTKLDDLGDPDFSIFDKIHIYQPFRGKYYRVGMMEFGRGCPYRCAYCANSRHLDIYWNHRSKYFRHRDPERFINLLKDLKNKYSLELIYFQDGTFLTMPNRILETLATLYHREIDLPCIVLSTAPSITETRIRYLKKMKGMSINVGIEHGDSEFRRRYLNRKMSNHQLIKAFSLLKENGIAGAAYSVIGFPYETRDDVMKTIDLNRKCAPDSIYPQIFYPIKGCSLYEACIREGFFDPRKESVRNEILGVGKVCLLEKIPMSRKEIHGLLRTFYLYVKMPKVLYPLIKFLENDNYFSRKIISFLTKYYWRQEAQFKI